MTDKGLPTTVEDARTVLSMGWLVWPGRLVATICLVAAMTSLRIGVQGGHPLVIWVAAPFFVLAAAAWTAAVRRLRIRVTAARELLADTA